MVNRCQVRCGKQRQLKAWRLLVIVKATSVALCGKSMHQGRVHTKELAHYNIPSSVFSDHGFSIWLSLAIPETQGRFYGECQGRSSLQSLAVLRRKLAECPSVDSFACNLLFSSYLLHVPTTVFRNITPMTEPTAPTLPVTARISASAETCHRSGSPPFTVTIIYECTATAPLWVFYPLQTEFNAGVEARDPTRNHRRIGPVSTYFDDERTVDITEDKAFLRLEPYDQLITRYTFTTEMKAWGLRHHDFYNLTTGNTYELTVRWGEWMWMFESDIPQGCSRAERRALVASQPVVRWKPDCMTTFRLV